MIQATEITVFKNLAITCLAGVIMPPTTRAMLKQEIEGVTLPIHLVMRCGTTQAKWNIYCNRVIGAVITALDDTQESDRIIAEYRIKLENRRF